MRRNLVSREIVGFLVLLAAGSAEARPGGGQTFVGPSQERPAPAVQPAPPAQPPVNVAPPADPPAPSGKTGAQWWKGSTTPTPDSTEPERPARPDRPDDGPVNEPQDARGRIRTNSMVFGAFMLVVAGVLLVRGVRRARENAKERKR